MKEEFELLRAAFQLLSKQDKCSYVLNMHEQIVNLDGEVECDGSALQEQIKDFLEMNDIDPHEFENDELNY